MADTSRMLDEDVMPASEEIELDEELSIGGVDEEGSDDTVDLDDDDLDEM